MTSAAKTAANRSNAAKSTGPRSSRGKARSRCNAFKHGLAIPISVDLTYAGQVDTLTSALAAESHSQGDAAARLVALAELELARAQTVKARLINQATHQFKKENYEGAELVALAYAQQMGALARLARYEHCALSKRARALQLLDPVPAAPDAIYWCKLFAPSVWAFNVHALVNKARESALHPLCVTWDQVRSNRLRITVQLHDDQSGRIGFAFENSDVEIQEFALTRLHGRSTGRQWCAICPKTGRRVKDLFLKQNETRLGSRFALELTYRSKLPKREGVQQPASDNAKPRLSIEFTEIPTDRQRIKDVTVSDSAPMADASVPIIDSSLLKAGEALLADGKLDEALASFRRHIELCQTAVAADGTNRRAARQLYDARRRIVDVAFEYLLIENFLQARNCVDGVLAAQPNSMTAALVRAHAQMLLGYEDDARVIYRQYRGRYFAQGISCDDIIRGHFDRLRRAGRTCHLMDEIEQQMPTREQDEEIASDSATTDLQTSAAEAHVEPAVRRLTDIELGDQLMHAGKLDEARDSYRRVLANSVTKSDEAIGEAQLREDADLAVGRLGALAFTYILQDKLYAASATIEEAISLRPHWLALQLVLSYCLVLGSRKTDGLNIHRKNCTQTMEDGSPWGSTIANDIADMRTAGYNLPILDEIERQFATKS